jgi:hypothetical protein
MLFNVSAPRATPTLQTFTATYSSNRIFFQWNIGNNEEAQRFEVEKSRNGKNYRLAALVFGTDSAELNNYWFYEAPGKKKMYYRLKMITKTEEVIYSKTITIK